jgi:hypothetical protein
MRHRSTVLNGKWVIYKDALFQSNGGRLNHLPHVYRVGDIVQNMSGHRGEVVNVIEGHVCLVKFPGRNFGSGYTTTCSGYTTTLYAPIPVCVLDLLAEL